MTDEPISDLAALDLPSDGPGRLVVQTVGDVNADLTTMMEVIARELDAFGCVLWQVSEGSKEEAVPPVGFLNTVAAWWDSNDLFALDDVKLAGSPAAEVALRQFSGRIVRDIQTEGGSARGHPFWRKHDIHAMCGVPVRFLEHNKGVLTTYRKGRASFELEDQVKLDALAKLVPGLVRALRERIGLRLVTEVERLVRKADLLPAMHKRPSRRAKAFEDVCERICEETAKAFSCMEVSLYLEDIAISPGNNRYRLVASSQPAANHRRFYQLPADSGTLTGWVLQNRHPIRISDLGKFERDQAEILKEYPGLTTTTRGWGDRNAAMQELKITEPDRLPPLSYMAVPVFESAGQHTALSPCGVLRCRGAKMGPYFFSKRELTVLEIVAAQIGQLWGRWQVVGALARENQAWATLSQGLGELNSFAYAEFEKPNPDEAAVFDQALNLIEKVIPGATLNSIRMHDLQQNDLFFSRFSRAAEQELKRLDSTARERRFPLTPYGRRKHLGVRVFLSGKVLSRDNVHFTSPKWYGAIFPTVRHIVIAPIGVEGEQFGLLDLRWTGDRIPPFAMQAAVLLGQQLGLYHQLARLVADVNAALAKAQQEAQNAIQLQRAEAQTLEDFSHQLRTPLAEVQMRIDQALTQSRSAGERRTLESLRGLFRRAERVAFSLRALSDVSYGRPLCRRLTLVDSDTLFRKLVELADDVHHDSIPKELQFTVDRAGFRPGVIGAIRADVALLEQMISNLLDNAAKYSFRKSVVRIFAGMTHSTNRPFIAVANKGLRFQPGEVEQSKLRGWRSANARLIVAEGHGRPLAGQ